MVGTRTEKRKTVKTVITKIFKLLKGIMIPPDDLFGRIGLSLAIIVQPQPAEPAEQYPF